MVLQGYIEVFQPRAFRGKNISHIQYYIVGERDVWTVKAKDG
jgi:hypothetical protein